MSKQRGQPVAGAMSMDQIAAVLGCSVRTVFNNFNSGMRKLRAQPGSFELLLHTVQAVAVERGQIDPLQPCSVECLVSRGEYVP